MIEEITDRITEENRHESDDERMVAALQLAFYNEQKRDAGIIDLEVRLRAMELRMARMEQQMIQHARERS